MDKQQCIDAMMKGKFNNLDFLFHCAKEENEAIYNEKLAKIASILSKLPPFDFDFYAGVTQTVIDYYRRKFNLTFLIYNNKIIKIY